ncbi:hypothetical protein GF402_05005 [Candidatus Fermentibacteria bacterium]|nr:hypothetical protein [Candidatus Fermentibacteria bacterium]
MAPVFRFRAIKVGKLVLGVVGLALILSFFLADSLGLTMGSYPSRYVVLVSGLGCILAALLGYRFGNFWKAIGIVLIGVVSLLVVLETVSLYLIDVLEEVETTLSVPVLRHSRPGLFKLEPYVGRRTKPGLTGDLTTDIMGFRKVPGVPPDSVDAMEVWLFGGDQVWGEGLPGESTVAAMLQEKLDDATSRPVRVRNMGQPGYVSTQELLLFMTMLRKDEYPVVVVRLDGYEEVFSAFCNGTAGDPIGYFGRAVESQEGRLATESALAGLRRQTAVGKLYTALIPQGDEEESFTTGARSFYGGINVRPEVLSEKVAEIYVQNEIFFEELAGLYGIRHYCFWQPNVWCCDKPLTPSEEDLRETLPVDCDERGERIFRDLLTMTDDTLRTMAGQRSSLYYLGEGYGDVEETMFSSGWVLSPGGNELLAERIARVLRQRESWL